MIETISPSLTLVEPSGPSALSSETHQGNNVSPRAAITTMVVVALLLRILIILCFHTYELQTRVVTNQPSGPHFAFGFETGSIAGSLARGEGFSSPFGVSTGATAWIAPVYPLMCAAIFKVFGIYTTASAVVILSLNSIFAALTCVPIYLIAKHVFNSRVATLSGWTWAVCVFFMRWPTTWIWEVSLSALLLSTLILLTFSAVAQEGSISSIKLGGVWGLAAITNPSLLGVLPFSLCWLAAQRHRALRNWFKPVFLTLAVAFAVTIPWLARNWIVMGKPLFIRDNFGFELYLGNYHGSNGLGFMGKHPTKNKNQLQFYSQLGELGYVKHFQHEALNFVKDYPEEFSILTLKRIVSFWDGGELNYESYVYWRWKSWEMLVLAVPTAFGLLLAMGRNKNTGAGLLSVVVLLYPLPYYFAYPQERYRHAIEPEMLIVSCFLACALWDHITRRVTFNRFGQSDQESA